MKTALAKVIPAETAVARRANVVQMAVGKDLGQLTLALTAPVGPNLSVADRLEAERRFGAIEPLLQPERFPLLYTTYPRRAQLMEWLAGQHQVAVRTLYHWLKLFAKGGLQALVERDRSDKGVPRVMNRAALEFLVAVALPRKGVAGYGTYSVAEMWRAYNEEREWRAAHVGRKMGDFEHAKYGRYIDEDSKLKADAQLPVVSIRTFGNWYQRIPDFIKVLGRDGVEAWHNTQEPITWRAISALNPMEYVVMDHRRLDVFCMAKGPQGEWRLVRPWITAALDMRTRKWLAFVMVEAPSSDSIAAVLKRVFIEHGLPENLYWDNGKDFTCAWLEGREERTETRGAVKELDTAWRGVTGTLGVRVVHAIPYNARAKTIEPNFGRIADFDRTLQEWCGHKPGARPERLEAMVAEHEAWTRGERGDTPFRTIGQMSAVYESAIAELNERAMERCEGMRKVKPGGGYAWWCPNEAWELLIGRVARRDVPADVLHMCFAKRRELTVQHAEVAVTFDGVKYHYQVVGSLDLARLNGEKVELAYDPLDLGDAAVYYRGQFFALVSCVQLRRMGEDTFVQDMRDRRSLLRETKAFIRMAHTVPIAGTVERLNRRRAVAPARAEVARAVVAGELPAAVVDAAAAVAAEKAFRFADAADVAAIAAVPASEDDGAFDFFGGTGA